ncbi:MAG: thiamine phosphate synthase [Verrucomicrobiaceae bacterium]|nr:thiamine phosphate synthase [Verrucomicrobiaceae bacterium]
MRSPASSCLYGIVDLGYVPPADVPVMTRQLVAGGADILQLRAKKLRKPEIEKLARAMLPVTRAAGVPLVINDHADVAAEVGSEGVHIGQDDGTLAAVREIVGPRCFIGRSTHSLDQAEAAAAEGADYIGFGPLHATGTKPDYKPIGLADIAEVHRRVSLPVFCIGGVNEARLPEILAAGARRVAIVSAFLLASDVSEQVRRVKRMLPSDRGT